MRIILIGSLILLNTICNGQVIPDSALYFGQVPPGDSAIVFYPGIVSIIGRTENRITFSADQKKCFFSAMGGPVLFMEYKNDGWTAPATQNSKFKSEPFFSLDGTKIYLNSRAALNQVGACDISYSERRDSIWTDPVSLGNPPNTPDEQYHPCIVADSSIYFSNSNGEICRSQYINGAYQQRTILPYPVNFANAGQAWGDPYVAPDESFLIFRSTRNGGYGGSDIYISYRKPDGSWTNPKNLGNKINTAGDELSGDITPDGKYMTFGRNNDLYWISSKFIDDLRNTNFTPYVKHQIPNQALIKNCLFRYQIPDNTFFDDDGNNSLSYSATLSDGSILPDWLSFDPVSKTFTGAPHSAGTYNIRVAVKDTANATASSSLNMIVSLPVIEYFCQTPSADSAILFVPGAVLQPNRLEHAGMFSRDGKEFYFSVISKNWDTLTTYVRKYINSSWMPEELAPFSSIYGGAAELFINNRNTQVVFVSSRKTATTDNWLKTDLWTVERTSGGWGIPKKINAVSNDVEVHWHPSISDSGRIYFGSKGAVYVAEYINDTTYGTPVKLNDSNINMTGTRNAEVCIAPDESYLIFSSNRSGGYGGNDLYISFKNKIGEWDLPVNVGPKINSMITEFSPSVTPDGKYLIFARDDGSTRQMYWVSMSFIDSLKQIRTEISGRLNVNPSEFNLFQNYPNPFNPSTKIHFSIVKSSFATLVIYNLLGQKVRILVNSFLRTGDYSIVWDATDESKSPVSSGVYFYRLTVENKSLQQKMLLLR